MAEAETKRKVIKKPIIKKPVVEIKETLEEKIRKVISSMFSDDDWSIESYNDNKRVMLRWKEIEIRNSNGLHHIIKDMIIILPFNEYAFVNSFRGTRLTISNQEYQYNYAHSHLNGIPQKSKSFCTGADSINDTWTTLKMTKYDDKRFEMILQGFIHHLESFIRYESLEGGPHKYISEIGARKQIENKVISSEEVLDEMKKFFSSNYLDSIELSMNFNNGQVQLIETDYFHRSLADHTNQEFHQKRLPNGNYAYFDNKEKDIKGFYIENTSILFHGNKKIYVEPLKGVVDKNSQETRYANHKITEEIKKIIEKKGSKILSQICEEKRVHNKDEKKRHPENWRKFDDSDTLLPIKEA